MLITFMPDKKYGAISIFCVLVLDKKYLVESILCILVEERIIMSNTGKVVFVIVRDLCNETVPSFSFWG